MERIERGEREKKDKTQVTPEPTRPDLFMFIEKLFEGSDQKPERIELRQAWGPGARKYANTTITQKEFKANAAKPTREVMVALSNELLDLAQNNCNAIGKPHKYGVLAKHYAKSDTYYAVHVLSLQPKQPADYDPSDVDDEDVPSDSRRKGELLQYALDHIKQSDENERWRQDQYSTATGDILERYQTLVDMLAKQNIEMQREHRELFRIADEALSRKVDRELAAEEKRFKLKAWDSGLTYLMQLAPLTINHIANRSIIPTEKSTESIAVAAFLEGLSDAQGKALFGEIDETTKELHPTGIFTPAQAKIFAGVAHCTEPPDALDRLLEGEHVVTEQQIVRAQAVISPQQFMPLVALVMNRKKRQLGTPAAPAAP